MSHRPYQNESGVGAVELLLLLVIAALVGGTGWYVWQTKQRTDKAAIVTPSSNGKQKPAGQATDPKTGWLRYTTPGGEYSITLPDGWSLTRFEKLPHLFGYTNDLGVQPGKLARVTEVSSGRDGMTTGLVVVYDVPKNISDTREGAVKTPSFYTDDGLLVEVHRYIEEVGGNFLGDLPQGTREYTYRITQVANGHILQVTYLCPPDGPDHYEVVETAVKTISIPK